MQIPWYSFIKEIRFLLTLSQSLPGKQENLSSSVSRHVNNVLVCIFSSILNSVMEEWKYKSRDLLKYIFFVTKKQ